MLLVLKEGSRKCLNEMDKMMDKKIFIIFCQMYYRFLHLCAINLFLSY